MKILFIAPRFPYPLLKGDQLTVYRRIKEISKSNEITLLTFSYGNTREGIDFLSPICTGGIYCVPFNKITAIFNMIRYSVLGDMPFQVSLYESKEFHKLLKDLLKKNHFDIVHFVLMRMDGYRSDVKNIPCVIDLIDSMVLNISRRIEFESGIKKYLLKLELEKVRRLEGCIHEKYDKMIVCAPKDKEEIAGDNTVLIPSTVDTKEFYPMLDKRIPGCIVFSGNMGYAPNEHAVIWFMENVYPVLEAEKIDFIFKIVGCNPSDRIKQLVNGRDNVIITGRVKSMPETLNTAMVSVAPMQSGSGMQGKILEAMACGVPVVATKIGKGGITADEENGLFAFNKINDIVTAIVNLLQDGNENFSIGNKAREYIIKHYDDRMIYDIINDIYHGVKC